MIPLESLLTIERIIGPDLIERFNAFTAAKIMGGPAPGYSSGQALAAMEEVAAQILSNDYGLGWTGSAYQEKAASGAAGTALVVGIVIVFLTLAGHYQPWSLPRAVLMALPFAVFRALHARWRRGP